MNTVYILTGGNLNNRMANLEEAKQALIAQIGALVSQSSIYQTAAWGPIAQPDYLNQVLKLETTLAPLTVLEKSLEIEAQMGRLRSERYAPRSIDIDILFYNDEIYDDENLIIPHPRLYTRRFVLVPLCEIAPQLVHPILGKTIETLLRECSDPLNVKKIIGVDAAD